MQKENYCDALQTLKMWNTAYHLDDKPLVSDDEYDALYRAVKKYEQENPEDKVKYSVTDIVGGELKDNLNKYKHHTKMYSMSNVFNTEELIKWLKSIECELKTDVLLEYKFDGLSINLIYEDGKLAEAVTRGDGEVGEIVTSNIIDMYTIPKTINCEKRIEIRGEICLPFKNFIILNLERDKEHKDKFNNVRNAAAGLIRTLGNHIVVGKHLVFHPWGIGEHSKEFIKQSNVMYWLEENGFKIDKEKIATNADQIEQHYKNMLKNREQMDFAIDGMVIKVNDIGLQNKLGYTVKTPKWCVAYKFPPMKKTTKILSIIKQVGRTGTITPVALVAPVKLDGALVAKVTLHNYKEIRRKDIRIGDIVNIVRSGDVIPKILSVVKEKRKGDEVIVKPPEFCESCNEPVIVEDARAYCSNSNCPNQIITKIAHFASRDYMNIDGLGIKIVEQLYSAGLLKDVEDLYKLTYSQIIELDGFKDKSTLNLLNNIERTKGSLLSKLLSSLNIPNVGRTVSKVIIEKMGIEFLNSSLEQFKEISGVGGEIAMSLFNYIDKNRDYLENIISIVNPTIDKALVVKDNFFKDKTIVITGSFNIPRNDIVDTLIKRGAKISNSVTSKTDIVAYGENSGSKLKKAEELNISTMNEEELNKHLKGN